MSMGLPEENALYDSVPMNVDVRTECRVTAADWADEVFDFFGNLR